MDNVYRDEDKRFYIIDDDIDLNKAFDRMGYLLSVGEFSRVILICKDIIKRGYDIPEFYQVMLLAEANVRTINELKDVTTPLDSFYSYNKVISLSDENTVAYIKSCNERSKKNYKGFASKPSFLKISDELKIYEQKEPNVAEKVFNPAQKLDNVKTTYVGNGKRSKILLFVALITAIEIFVIYSVSRFISKGALASFNNTSDLEIKAVYYLPDDNLLPIEAINKSDMTIISFVIAVTGFDNNGNPVKIGNEDYITVQADGVNLMPGEVLLPGANDNRIIDWALGNSDNLKYVETTVVEIEYSDGTKWKTEGINKWAKTVAKNFSIDEYKNYVDGLSEQARNAEENGFINITDWSLNRYTNIESDLRITYDNLSDKAIREIVFLTLEYDKNDYAVSVSNYRQFISKNGQLLCHTDTVPSGYTIGETFGYCISMNTDKIKIIPYTFEFEDGTTWANPNAIEWIIYNCDYYK